MIANALGPIFLLILFGALLKWFKFPGEQFWPGVERLTYFVLIPALLIHKLAFADFNSSALRHIAISIVIVFIVISLAIFAVRRIVAKDGPSFTSVFQGSIRFNSYLGLAIANELYGESGFVLAALTVGILIPLVNLLCVASFALVESEHRIRWRTFALSLAQNPLIIACISGMMLNLTGIGLPGWSAPTFAIISAAALPLGLLAVGVAIDVKAIIGTSREVVLSSIAKFLLLPVLMLATCSFMGLEALTQQVLMLFASLPTATSGYILARQLGGNTILMANIITFQVLLAFAIMPIWISLSNNLLLR